MDLVIDETLEEVLVSNIFCPTLFLFLAEVAFLHIKEDVDSHPSDDSEDYC